MGEQIKSAVMMPSAADAAVHERAAPTTAGADSNTGSAELLDLLAQPQIAIPLLAALGALLFLINLGGYPFYTKGEPREAVTVFDIVHGNGVILPLRAGVEIPSKPLLMHWLAALVSLAAGEVSEWTVRLPSAVFAILGLIVCYWYLSTLFRQEAGLIGALILGTSCQYLQAGTGARVDITLTFFLEVAFFEFIAVAQGMRRRTAPLYLAIACALLTKGPIGLALPVLAASIWMLVWGRPELLSRLQLGRGALIIAALAGGWYLGATWTGGAAFVHKQLLAENLHRLLGHRGFHEGHAHPWYYMEGALLAGFMPWSPLAVLAAVELWQHRLKIDARFGYLLVWFVAVLVFFNFPQSKRGVYLLALYPALSGLIGIVIAEVSELRSPAIEVGARLLCRLAGAVFIATGASAIAGVVLLYQRPAALRWLLGELDILAAGFLPAMRACVSQKWAISSAVPLAAIVLGSELILLRPSVSRLIGGAVAGVLAITLAINLVVEPAIADTLSPKQFAERAEALAGSTSIYYFGSLDYAFVFYSRRDVKFVGRHDAPGLIVGREEQWPLLPADVRARYSLLQRSNPTELDGSGRLLLLRKIR